MCHTLYVAIGKEVFIVFMFVFVPLIHFITFHDNHRTAGDFPHLAFHFMAGITALGGTKGSGTFAPLGQAPGA